MSELRDGFVSVSRDQAESPQRPERAAVDARSSESPLPVSEDRNANTMDSRATSEITPAPTRDSAGNARQVLRTVSRNFTEGASTLGAFCLPDSMRRDSGSTDPGDSEQHSPLGASNTSKQVQRNPASTEAKQRRKLTPKQQILQDKIAFFVGVVNLVLTAFWLGKSPHTWYRWFTVKALILFTVRYNVYRSKQWHYYMLEFCYFANVLLLVQIWVLPNWAWMYKATFSQIAGPMTAAIPALGNSLVLHSLDKTTSLFMHVSPALMAWALRWYPSQQAAKQRAADTAAWEDAGFWDLVVLPMLLYSLWAAFYYLKIFVVSSEKVKKNNYSTLYTLMTGKKGSLPARIVLQAPQQLQPVVYMLMHLLLVLVATFTSLLWWHSFWAHTLFVIACASSSAWLGATYQFDIFAHRYLAGMGLEPQVKKKAT